MFGPNKPAPKRVRGRLREYFVHWDVFNFPVHVVVGPLEDVPAYVDWRQKSNVPVDIETDGTHGQAGYYFYAQNARGGVIWLRSAPRAPNHVGHLVHEMLHAVLDMVRNRGFRMNKKTEETICYALADGVEQVLLEVRKR